MNSLFKLNCTSCSDIRIIKYLETFRLAKKRSPLCKKCKIGLNRKTHGMSLTSMYRIWQGMKQRCFETTSVSYKHYGGRGITICDHWMKFENFLEDMGERPPGLSIDRINNNGNYEPGNCRWATQSQQMRNTRRSKIYNKPT